MSDKFFSIGKGIREVVERGALTGIERTVHFELEREDESTLAEFKWLRGGNPRDIRLNVPVELFTRQITTVAFPIGTESFGVSNLLTWSASLRAGATLLTGLSRNATLWSIGQLPVPQWLPEIGMVAPSDPLFLGYAVTPKRKLIEDANVDMTNYGVLCSTDSKRILNSNPAFVGGSDSVWEKLRNPISSPEITDDRCFTGCWNNMTFCL